jgi:hypothetical protein
MWIVSGVLLGVGGGCIGGGAFMLSDDPNHGGEFIGGAVLTGFGAAAFITGGVLLLLTALDHPQEIGSGKGGITYLDASGRLPNASGAKALIRELADAGLKVKF